MLKENDKNVVKLMYFEIGGMISMKRLFVCFVLILSFVCMPTSHQNIYGATKAHAQSKYVSNKVLKKWAFAGIIHMS